MTHRSFALVAVLLCCVGPASSQDKKKADNDQAPLKKDGAAKENAAHDELREVKKAMTDAFNKKDLDALLKHVHKDVVVTWQDGKVSRGHDEIKKYYNTMLTGNQSVLIKVEADPVLPENSILYGEPPTTAVAFGLLNDKYSLREGTNIDMQSRFSATLVKEDGKWLIVNFHGSADVFRNEVLNLAVSRTMWITGSSVAVVALLIGLILGRLMGGKKAG